VHLAVLLVVLARAVAPIVVDCGLIPPVEATVIQPYAPIGRYGGHWGIDFAVPVGSAVLASDGGVISFAGVVAGNRTLTVDHGGGLRSSYSYLSAINVVAGSPIGRGEKLGSSGVAHGTEAVHFSVRIDGSYVDPTGLFDCLRPDSAGALRLVPVSRSSSRLAYPVERETRNTRRDFRSTAHRPSDRR
jgi:murein DD-endopeptidase MepM/ murein hydrolase activator NlpD